MVGSGGVQVPGLQATPECRLVFFATERWAHDVRRRKGKVFVLVHAVIHHQVARQHLAIHTLAVGTGAGNGCGAVGTGHMHHIDGHVQHIGNGDGALHRFGFNRRGA